MKKTTKKILMAILVLSLIISSCPVSIFATDSGSDSDAYEEVYLIEQDELRNENSKTYYTSDNTYVSVVTTSPICYEKDGEFIDIDNSIVTDDSGNLTNKDNSFSVELPKKYEQNSGITVSKDGYSFTIKLSNEISTSKAKLADNKDENEVNSIEEQVYEEATRNTSNSTVKYNNLFDHVDVEYVMLPDGIKENLIINKVPDEELTIQYTIETDNLSILLNDDNSLSFVDDNETEIFVLPATFMYDSNNNVSYDINLTFEQNDNGNYDLCYTPSYDWLSSEEIEFPVIVDPDITLSYSAASITDTYINSNSPSTKYPNATTLYVQGKYGAGGTCKEAYYKINNLPNFPSGVMINNATFGVYKAYTGGDEASNKMDMQQVYSDNSNFITTLNYNTRTNIPSSNYTFMDSETISNSTGFVKFNITEAVQNWLSNSVTNKILCMSGNVNTNLRFASCEYNNSNNRPYIAIEYSAANGINDSNKYHTLDLGYAGTAYINDATGELLVKTYDYSYNGYNSNTELSIALGANISSCSGLLFANMDLNYFEMLEKKQYQIAGKTVFEQSEYDGSTQYYVNVSGNTYYNINTGGEYTIDEQDDTYTLTNSDNSEIKTYKNEQLTEISLKSDLDDDIYSTTSVTYNYVYENNTIISAKLASITDSSGIKYQADYNNDGIITSFVYSYPVVENIETGIEHDNPEEYFDINFWCSDNHLNSITSELNDDIKTVYYNWDNNLIESIIDENDIKTEFTYDSLNRVTSIKKRSKTITEGQNVSREEGNEITFSYGNKTTTITDSYGNSVIETFDKNGVPISIYNSDGTSEFIESLDGALVSKQSENIKYSQNFITNGDFEFEDDNCFYDADELGTITNSQQYSGQKSLCVVNTQNGTPLYAQASVSNTNKTYTASCYVKVSNNSTAKLSVSNTTNTNSPDYQLVESNTYTESSDWQLIQCSINSNDEKYIDLALTTTGTVYVDCVSVEENMEANGYNLVSNGEFNANNNDWVTSGNEVAIINQASGEAPGCDSYALCLDNDFSNSVYAYKSIAPNNANSFSEGEEYSFGAWSKSLNTLPSSEMSNRYINLSVYGANNAISSYSALLTSDLISSVDFNLQSDNWQYLASGFTLEDDYNFLYIVLSTNCETGTTLFDGVNLYENEFYCVEYNNYADYYNLLNPVKSVRQPEIEYNTDSSTVTETYDNTNHTLTTMKELTDVQNTPKDIDIEQFSDTDDLIISKTNELDWDEILTYDIFKHICKIENANGEVVDYEWDAFDRITGVKNELEDSNLSGQEYTYEGSLLTNIKYVLLGEDNNTSIKLVIDALHFEYDKWNNLVGVYFGNDEYDYNDIYEEGTNSQYQPVVSTQIIGYEYNSNNLITKINFNNNESINFVYDSNNNLINIKSNQAQDQSYAFNTKYYYYDNGVCYGKWDIVNNLMTTYQDGLTKTYDPSDNNTVFQEFGTDSNGTKHHIVNNAYWTTNSSYNDSDNSITTETQLYNEGIEDANVKIVENYDSFGRVSGKNYYINNSNTPFMYSVYSYVNSNTTSILSGTNPTGYMMNHDSNNQYESNMVRSVAYYKTIPSGNDKRLYEYRFIYDSSGRIASFSTVVDESDSSATDELYNNYCYTYENGIIKEELEFCNNIWLTYNLDEFGNVSSIKRKKIFYGALIGGTNPETTVHSYSYNYENYVESNPLFYNSSTDEVNLDLGLNNNRLSGLDGNTVTYDLNGNVTSFGNMDFSYALRNQLTGVESSNNECNYSYYSDGYRNSKEDFEGNYYNYYWEDGKLVSQSFESSEYGSCNTIVLYDYSNNPYGFILIDCEGQAIPYFYLTDQTGKINGIVDGNGNVIALYEYSTWGEITFVEENDIDNGNDYQVGINLINPLFYKGYIYDSDTSLYYIANRYYSPVLQRYLSINPVLDTQSGSAYSANLYLYCENDPVNCHSTNGMDTVKDSDYIENYFSGKYISPLKNPSTSQDIPRVF